MIEGKEPVFDEQIEEMSAPLCAGLPITHMPSTWPRFVARLSLAPGSVWWQRTVAVPVPLRSLRRRHYNHHGGDATTFKDPLKPDADGLGRRSRGYCHRSRHQLWRRPRC